MSFTTVLAEVKAVLEGVSSVQNVHDYPRWSADLVRHKSLFVANSKFEFWQIERVSAPSEASLDGQVFRDHQFHLWYIREVDDSAGSEKLGQQLVDEVCNAFNQKANLILNGTADQVKAAELIEKTDAMVGGVLCNVFQVGVWANEEVTV